MWVGRRVAEGFLEVCGRRRVNLGRILIGDLVGLSEMVAEKEELGVAVAAIDGMLEMRD